MVYFHPQECGCHQEVHSKCSEAVLLIYNILETTLVVEFSIP